MLLRAPSAAFVPFICIEKSGQHLKGAERPPSGVRRFVYLVAEQR
jgi:hypothetical protein